jgi:hypothetical protein
MEAGDTWNGVITCDSLTVCETYDTTRRAMSNVLPDTHKVAKAYIIREWSPYDRDAYGS